MKKIYTPSHLGKEQGLIPRGLLAPQVVYIITKKRPPVQGERFNHQVGIQGSWRARVRSNLILSW